MSNEIEFEISSTRSAAGVTIFSALFLPSPVSRDNATTGTKVAVEMGRRERCNREGQAEDFRGGTLKCPT